MLEQSSPCPPGCAPHAHVRLGVGETRGEHEAHHRERSQKPEVSHGSLPQKRTVPWRTFAGLARIRGDVASSAVSGSRTLATATVPDVPGEGRVGARATEGFSVSAGSSSVVTAFGDPQHVLAGFSPSSLSTEVAPCHVQPRPATGRRGRERGAPSPASADTPGRWRGGPACLPAAPRRRRACA
jgi:hypothetical protein